MPRSPKSVPLSVPLRPEVFAASDPKVDADRKTRDEIRDKLASYDRTDKQRSHMYESYWAARSREAERSAVSGASFTPTAPKIEELRRFGLTTQTHQFVVEAPERAASVTPIAHTSTPRSASPQSGPI
jgi:hypothetical protein